VELREISIYEAEQYDMPSRNQGLDEECTWYVLDDDGEYKGFMEITQHEDIDEITYFMVPGMYTGNGYGKMMLELFLDKYIERSLPDSMLTTVFEYNGAYGDALSDIFRDCGFDISLRRFDECAMPFEAFYERLAIHKPLGFKGTMDNLAYCINDVLDNLRTIKDSDITLKDVRESDIELSVAAIDSDGKLEALLLASDDDGRRDVVVTHLYTATEDPVILRKFFAFAVENAKQCVEVPRYISFVAANKKLESVMKMLFDAEPSSEIVMADAEFNLGRYVKQLNILESLRR
jgi:hypothetical protein